MRYSPRNVDGMTYFNLGFGDWNEAEARIDDVSTTNNAFKKGVGWEPFQIGTN